MVNGNKPERERNAKGQFMSKKASSSALPEASPDRQKRPPSILNLISKWDGRLRPRSLKRSQKNAVGDLAQGVENISLESEDVDNAVEMAGDVLRSEKLCHVGELQGARDAVDEFANTRTILAKFRKAHSEIKHVKARSFSMLTWQDLKRMGINKVSPFGDDVDRDNKIQQAFSLALFKDSKSLSEIFPPFWISLIYNTDFLETFEEILDTVGKRPEARARLVTNHVILRVMRFLNKNLDLVPLLFLELRLSASTDAEPVIIVHEDRATLITGTVDYAIISPVSTAKKLGETKIKDHIGKLIGEGSLEKILQEYKALANRIQEGNQFRLTIIEEKRKEFTGKKLANCVPQVIGEALAISRKTGRNLVPWCISNGEEWLFGLLSIKEGETAPNGLRIHQLPGVTLSQLEVVFKLLIIWTAMPDLFIENTFFAPSA